MQHDVWIPAVHRDLTGGAERVQLEGETVGEIIDRLDERYPGIKARLCDGNRVRPHIAVAINGQIYRDNWEVDIPQGAEVYLMPRLQGG